MFIVIFVLRIKLNCSKYENEGKKSNTQMCCSGYCLRADVFRVTVPKMLIKISNDDDFVVEWERKLKKGKRMTRREMEKGGRRGNKCYTTVHKCE